MSHIQPILDAFNNLISAIDDAIATPIGPFSESIAEIINLLTAKRAEISPFTWEVLAAVAATVVKTSDGRSPTLALLRRHLAEAPKVAPSDTPAISCHVMVAGVNQLLSGALSVTPEGGLRLLTVIPDPSVERRPGIHVRTPPELVEQFFDFEDVRVFALTRTVEATAPSPIIRPGARS